MQAFNKLLGVKRYLENFDSHKKTLDRCNNIHNIISLTFYFQNEMDAKTKETNYKYGISKLFLMIMDAYIKENWT